MRRVRSSHQGPSPLPSKRTTSIIAISCAATYDPTASTHRTRSPLASRLFRDI